MQKELKFLATFARVVEEEFKKFLKKHAEQLGDRKGLACLVYQPGQQKAFNGFEFSVGTFPTPQNQAEKIHFAHAKVKELVVTGNVTTFPTQDYALAKYGGGIKGNRYYFSVSGFPPELDHLFLRKILKKTKALHGEQLSRVDEEFKKYKDQGVVA